MLAVQEACQFLRVVAILRDRAAAGTLSDEHQEFYRSCTELPPAVDGSPEAAGPTERGGDDNCAEQGGDGHGAV